MHTLPRTTWTRRLAVTISAVASVLGLTVVVTPAADASVYGSCTISRCADARSARTTWSSKGYPSTRGWNSWPNGQCNFAGGQFYNREGQLPGGHSYLEFDVYPRACGAARDAYRIIVDRTAGTAYFSPNHYTDFYRL
ncbi:ribonuclease domain-containing protein [Saccharothrix syringae]|uniref:Ribonuclease N n=1 Tax=Saccharothrix syringae TaxID=103733 RepID=A0A5Q0H5V3_SACSY|nr:ribonuclease domain-containing protein [Saccharothrix syringae]QFZ21285.1 ribonuclease N [Saccharothrix syringae]